MRPDQHRDRVPTYQGRPLPRPDEEIVDQGLGFDLGTLLGRRQVLRAIGLGVTGLGLAACDPGPGGPSAATSAGATSSGATSPGATAAAPTTSPSAAGAAAAAREIPEETAGPFPGDGSNGPNVLRDSGIIRTDIRPGFGAASGTAQGVPMTLELIIKDLAKGGGGFAGAAVYVWHCDREGRYSLYSDGVTDQNYLRGVQIADAAGRVRFTTIFPACYPGRWPHVHFEVYPDQASIADAGKVIATSQVALPKDACERVYAEKGYESSVAAVRRVSLRSDNVFRDDAAASQLGTVTGDLAAGYAVSLVVPIDTTTPGR